MLPEQVFEDPVVVLCPGVGQLRRGRKPALPEHLPQERDNMLRALRARDLVTCCLSFASLKGAASDLGRNVDVVLLDLVEALSKQERHGEQASWGRADRVKVSLSYTGDHGYSLVTAGVSTSQSPSLFSTPKPRVEWLQGYRSSCRR